MGCIVMKMKMAVFPNYTSSVKKSEQEVTCNKHYSKLDDRTGGVDVFRCLEHGASCGANIIDYQETCKDV